MLTSSGPLEVGPGEGAMSAETTSCPRERFDDYRRCFEAVDESWLRETEVDGRAAPMLALPSALFRWEPKLGYSVDLDVRVLSGTTDALLFLRILSFDPELRRSEPPDFCIPMAFPGATRRQELSWTLFAGAWSDSREEAVLVLDASHRRWAERLDGRLLVYEVGREAASIVSLGDREREPVGRFLAALGG